VPLYIKTAYQDEPSFRDSKVVFSLFGDDLKSNLQDNIIDKLILKNIVREDIESILPASATYKDLCKLAISYSDGVIQNSKDVDPELLAYAREKGIPVLEYDSSETYAEAFNNFYDTIYSQEK
jgi:starch synthase